MKQLITICLLMLIAFSVEAQDDELVVVGYGKSDGSGKVKILAKSQCCPQRCDIEYNSKTKKSTGIWDDLEMGYIKDKCEVQAPIATDFNRHFPNAASGLPKDYALLYWVLTEENDETVLHCYFTMPADEVQNLWLACEETSIVDMETGIQYRARRTAPDCWRKHFSVKAPVGTPLDFKIYFPKLSETTKRIAIYGVPLWGMRGLKVEITRNYNAYGRFDNAPQIRKPQLVKEPENYDKNNSNTWPVFNNPQLIKPVEEGTMALWCTENAAYLAVAHEQNWMREYYGISAGTTLIDNRGHRYKLKEIQGLPADRQFWIEAYSGDFIVFVMEFERIPPNVDILTYIEPDREDFEMWGADPEGKVIGNLNVEELRANQRLFEPIERIIK